MLETISMPAAKVIQLYGLDSIPGPTKRISERSKAFEKEHKLIGKASSALGWVPVWFSITQVGISLSRALAPLGGMVADIIGYTAAFLHPSLISLGIRKLAKQKADGVGVTRYFEAAAMAEPPALIALFALLSLGLHWGNHAIVSATQTVATTVASSFMDLALWSGAFTLYWSRVVRGEGRQPLAGRITEFGRGALAAATPWKGFKATTAVEEAGAMMATGFLIWAIPWYMVRAYAAAKVTGDGIRPGDFTGQLFSYTSLLEPLNVALHSLKLHFVERIMKRREEGDG